MSKDQVKQAILRHLRQLLHSKKVAFSLSISVIFDQFSLLYLQICSECGDIGQINNGTNLEFSDVDLVSKHDLSHAQQLEGQFHQSLDDPAVK